MAVVSKHTHDGTRVPYVEKQKARMPFQGSGPRKIRVGKMGLSAALFLLSRMYCIRQPIYDRLLAHARSTMRDRLERDARTRLPALRGQRAVDGRMEAFHDGCVGRLIG